MNFETAYNIARPVFLHMMQQGEGIIFMTGSQAGLNANKAKGSTAYALSKSLLFRLAEIMNAEAAGTNVRVKIIVPSIIDTPQNRKAMPTADHSKWKSPSYIAQLIFDHTTGDPSLLNDKEINVPIS